MNIRIRLNGSPREVPDGTRIADLVEGLELRSDQVAVEVNRELVQRRLHAETRLADGDEIEVVTLVGGG